MHRLTTCTSQTFAAASPEADTLLLLLHHFCLRETVRHLRGKTQSHKSNSPQVIALPVFLMTRFTWVRTETHWNHEGSSAKRLLCRPNFLLLPDAASAAIGAAFPLREMKVVKRRPLQVAEVWCQVLFSLSSLSSLPLPHGVTTTFHEFRFRNWTILERVACQHKEC